MSAQGPEAKLYQRVKRGLTPHGVLLTRLENRVGLGLPDCLLALPGKGFVLVELKVVTAGNKVRLSPHQIAFQLRHAQIGSPVWVMVEHRPTATIRLYRGDQVEGLYENGILKTKPAAQWPLASVEWGIIYGFLSCAAQMAPALTQG